MVVASGLTSQHMCQAGTLAPPGWRKVSVEERREEGWLAVVVARGLTGGFPLSYVTQQQPASCGSELGLHCQQSLPTVTSLGSVGCL